MTDETPTEIAAATVWLRPEAIVDYELPRAKRGYDREAVDDLLDRLAAQTTELLREVAALRQDRQSLLGRLEAGSETESALKRTLLTAQRAAELSVQEAEGQAESIRRRALTRAEELLTRAAEEAHELREAALRRARADEAEARRRRRVLDEHVEQLRAFAQDHHERVAHHLRRQLERLDTIEVPAPPPEPVAAADPILDEPRLERDVDALVAELASEVDAPPSQPSDASPATASDASPATTDDASPATEGPWTGAVAPLSTSDDEAAPDDDEGPDGQDDVPPAPVDLRQMLAQIDGTADEVVDAYEQAEIDDDPRLDDDASAGDADDSVDG